MIPNNTISIQPTQQGAHKARFSGTKQTAPVSHLLPYIITNVDSVELYGSRERANAHEAIKSLKGQKFPSVAKAAYAVAEHSVDVPVSYHSVNDHLEDMVDLASHKPQKVLERHQVTLTKESSIGSQQVEEDNYPAININEIIKGYPILQWTLNKYLSPRSDEDVKQLLQTPGVNVNQRSIYGSQTALHDAVKRSPGLFQEFLKVDGADVDAQDSQKRTPLHHAIMRDCPPQNILLLLLAKASLKLPDCEGKTPVQLAKEKQHPLANLLELCADSPNLSASQIREEYDKAIKSS